jgi:hypothetical protein
MEGVSDSFSFAMNSDFGAKVGNVALDRAQAEHQLSAIYWLLPPAAIRRRTCRSLLERAMTDLLG